MLPQLPDLGLGFLYLNPGEVRGPKIPQLRRHKRRVRLMRRALDLLLRAEPLRSPPGEVLAELVPGGHLLLEQQVLVLPIPHLGKFVHQPNRATGGAERVCRRRRRRPEVGVYDRIDAIGHRSNSGLVKKRRRCSGAGEIGRRRCRRSAPLRPLHRMTLNQMMHRRYPELMLRKRHRGTELRRCRGNHGVFDVFQPPRQWLPSRGHWPGALRHVACDELRESFRVRAVGD